MEPKTLLNADYLDIIFDKRNKTYGGYELRRNYNRRVKKAAGIMAIGMASILSFSFIAVRHNETVNKPYTKPTTICSLIIPETIKPPLPSHPPTPQAAKALHPTTRSFTPPQIVVDNQIPDDKQMSKNKGLPDAQPGTANTTGTSTTTGANGDGLDKKGSTIDIGSRSSTPVRWVAQMPEFPGDMNAYMNGHLHYPDLASSSQISGRVIVEFVVNEDGSVSNVKVLRGIGGGCDEEALRMVSAMPKWKPGKQNGIPVKVLFTLPINFVLN